MIVADSSIIVEGLLKQKALLEEDLILTADLAVYEVTNAIWKHQHILHDVEDGLEHLTIFHGLLESNRIRAVHPGPGLMRDSYDLAGRNGLTVYDSVFVALAIEAELNLRTLDNQQAAVFRREVKKRSSR